MKLLLYHIYILFIAVVNSLSTDFPSIEDSVEFARLSDLSYEIDPSVTTDCNDIIDFYPDLLHDDLICLLYTPESNVIVLLSELHGYVSVVYRGTQDTKDWITDVRARLIPFGKDRRHLIAPRNLDVRVHDGFNIDVFKSYDAVYSVVENTIIDKPHLRIVVTGHSLGAANSILCAAALATHMPHQFIESISYASPLTGNTAWKDYVNSLHNLGVWRFVHLTDIVPRSPPFREYHHPGHTFQLEEEHNMIYYLHYGDEELLYAGIPESWKSDAYEQLYDSAQMHFLDNYIDYITNKCVEHPDIYYNLEFMRIPYFSDLNENTMEKA